MQRFRIRSRNVDLLRHVLSTVFWKHVFRLRAIIFTEMLGSIATRDTTVFFRLYRDIRFVPGNAK